MAAATFNLEVFGIMLGYAVLNGAGSLLFKLGLDELALSNADAGGNPRPVRLVGSPREASRFLVSMFRQPKWVAGLLLLVSDFFVYQLALGKYEVSVVKPLVNLNLVFVIAFGVTIVGERLLAREVAAIAALVVGGLLVTHGSREVPLHSVPAQLAWFGAASVAFVASLGSFLGRVYQNRPGAMEYAASLLSGVLYGLGALFNKAAYSESSRGLLAEPWLYLFAASYLGAFLLGQQAYASGRMSLASSLVNVASVLVPFVGGVAFFEEGLSALKAFGFALAVGGVLLAGGGGLERKEEVEKEEGAGEEDLEKTKKKE
ncbi:MAG: hypothetical protein Kow0069_05070 [Promethearchaeota archaeon]